MTSIAPAPLPYDIAKRVAEVDAKQINLYQSLAHAPDLLRAWVDFAWALRSHNATSRRLRELMILRTAIQQASDYEWHQHVPMARSAGVTDQEMKDLKIWQVSNAFSTAEKTALAFTDAVVAGRVPPAVTDELIRNFDETQRVELTVTAAFYSMVPRVLAALGVQIEGNSGDCER